MRKEREIMTKFVKENFSWDGMYLMYQGEFEGSRTMEEVSPNCHESWHGMPERTFIARFKYGSKPYKSWINFLVKHATIEKYIELSDHRNKFWSDEYGYEVSGSPVYAMEALGFVPRKKRS
jgi:hypothetical protein